MDLAFQFQEALVFLFQEDLEVLVVLASLHRQEVLVVLVYLFQEVLVVQVNQEVLGVLENLVDLSEMQHHRRFQMNQVVQVVQVVQVDLAHNTVVLDTLLQIAVDLSAVESKDFLELVVLLEVFPMILLMTVKILLAKTLAKTLMEEG